MILNIKIFSINKLFIYALLQLLLLLESIQKYDRTTQEKVLLSMYDYLENRMSIFTRAIIENKSRILTEKGKDTEESTIPITAFPTSSIEKWKLHFPEHIIYLCKEYEHMKQEFQNRIFLSNEEMKEYFKTLQSKRELVQSWDDKLLLYEHDVPNVGNAKTLQYYTISTCKDCKIQKLVEALQEYFVMLCILQEVMALNNVEEKEKCKIKLEAHSIRIKNLDPSAQEIIEKELKNVEVKILSSINNNQDHLIKSEIKKIIKAVDKCFTYMELIDVHTKYDECTKQKYISHLYNIEKELAIEVPQFFHLYISRNSTIPQDT